MAGGNVLLAPGFEHTCDEVGVLTWIDFRPNEQINSNTELHGGNCIQDARDPFVLPRDSVCSVTVKVSERVQIKEEMLDL